MATHAVTLDEKHFRAAQEKARALGTTPDEYVRRLIDTADALADLSLDDLLAPVREGFAHLTDDQLDALFADAERRSSTRRGP